MNIETIDALISAAGGLLWRASWQGGLAIFLVWALVRTVRALPPVCVSWFWRLAYLKLLFCLVWTTPIAVPVLPERPLTVRRPLANQPTLAPPLPSVPFAARAGGHAPASTTPIAQPFPWPRVVALIYLLGGLGVGAMYARQWLRLRGWRQRATTLTNADWSSTLQQLTAQFGMRSAPELKMSREAASPLLCGSWRPIILLPANCPSGDQDRAIVLAHELGHLQARDLWWNWLVLLCDILFFFHPAIWLGRRQWRLAQEIAADAIATRQTRIAPAEYGRSLLELRRNAGTLGLCKLMAAPVVDSIETLKERLTAMKYFRSYPPRLVALATLILMSAAALVLVPWRLTAQTVPVQLANPDPVINPITEAAEAKEAKEYPPSDPNTSAQLADRKQAAELPTQPPLLERRTQRLRLQDELEVLRAEYSVRLMQFKKAQADLKASSKMWRDEAVSETKTYEARLAMSRAEVDMLRARAEVRAVEHELQAEQVQLVKAQEQLDAARLTGAALPGGRGGDSRGARDEKLNEAWRSKMRKLLEREMEVTQRQVELIKKQVTDGHSTQDTLLRAQAELLRAKQEAAQLDGKSDLRRKLYEDQIEQLRILEENAQKRYKNGVSSEEDVLAVQLEILALQRRMLDAELRQ